MKKLGVVVGCLILAGVIAVVTLQAYLRWQDPVGYRNLRACQEIPVGASLDQVKAVLGEPIATSTSRGLTWLSFRTASIAAGQIRAAVQPSTGKVIALRCDFDGPDTWSLEGRAASNFRIQRPALRAAADPARSTYSGKDRRARE